MLGFDIPTFVFQIVNFVVLLVILAKFFYRPVLDVMKRRQDQIDARIADADQRAGEADAERKNLSEQTETARRAAVAMLDSARNEAAQERQRLVEMATKEAANLIEEARRTAAMEQQTATERLGKRVSQTAVSIAGALIRDSSGVAVHKGLVDRLLTEGFGLGPSAEQQTPAGLPVQANRVIVESAYPLDSSQEEGLRRHVAQALSRSVAEVQMEVRQDDSLIAGLRIVVGGLVVDMSVKHLLEELSHRDGAVRA